jgi:hypothetical protein
MTLLPYSLHVYVISLPDYIHFSHSFISYWKYKSFFQSGTVRATKSWLVMSTFRFFVNETNTFFAFNHEKTNDWSFFYLYKTKIMNVVVWFFFCAQSRLNKTQRFVPRSNWNLKLWSALISISNLNEILSSRSKSCILSDIKCSVVEPHHFYAAPALAPTLLYSKEKF